MKLKKRKQENVVRSRQPPYGATRLEIIKGARIIITLSCFYQKIPNDTDERNARWNNV